MDFRSDNVAGAAPEILKALTEGASGAVSSYGADPVTERLSEKMSALFGREVATFPVATGTAANSLALSALCPPYGAVYCHRDAHIQVDECGAPEFFTGGAKLVLLDGTHGKIEPDTLTAALAESGQGEVHHVQPAALSLTQATEAGTVYRPDEVAALSEIAHGHGMAVHMDGARFANAVAHLGCDPADITWRAGVDALSFGATKNGCMAAEAVVFFDPEKARDFPFRRKRAGHLFSKSRFLSLQLDAYLEDGLWLRLASYANAQAARLAEGLSALPGVELAHPVEANEIFVTLPAPVAEGLEEAGFRFYRWPDGTARLVMSFATDPAHVDAFLDTARDLAGRQRLRA